MSTMLLQNLEILVDLELSLDIFIESASENLLIVQHVDPALLYGVQTGLTC